MRIEYTFRVACRATGVTKATGIIFVNIRPVKITIFRFDQIVKAIDIFQLGFGHMRLVCEDDEPLHIGDRIRNRFENRNKACVEDDELVFGMIDNIGQLLSKKAGVQGVADGPHTHNTVPGLHVPVCVPGHGGDHVSLLDAQLGEGLCCFARAQMNICISRAMNRPLDRPRDHFALAVEPLCVIDNAHDRKRPILHQAFHLLLPIF